MLSRSSQVAECWSPKSTCDAVAPSPSFYITVEGYADSVPGDIMKLASEVQASYSVDSRDVDRAADLALHTCVRNVISSGSLADTDKVILVLRQVGQDIPHDYFDKLQRLTNLSLTLEIHYEFCGDLGDLDESIATHEEAIQFTPCGHPSEPAMLTNNGVLFLRRFGRYGDLGYLSKFITLTEDAVPCTPDHHFDYPGRMACITNALLASFQLLGEMQDFFRPTSMLEMAVWLTQLHYPERPAILIISAISLARLTRFYQLGDSGELDNAITLIEETMELTPSAKMLTLLSSAYFTGYEILGVFANLLAAISSINNLKAAALTPKGYLQRHPMLAALVLGSSYASNSLATWLTWTS